MRDQLDVIFLQQEVYAHAIWRGRDLDGWEAASFQPDPLAAFCHMYRSALRRVKKVSTCQKSS